MEPLCPATQRCTGYGLQNMFLTSAEITCNSITGAMERICQNTNHAVTHDEYTMHICCCTDSGHNRLFHSITVRELYTWMVKTLGNCAVASTVEAHLLARGETATLSLMHGTSVDLSVVCKQRNCLGWDSLLDGRMSSHWLVLISPLLQHQPKNLLPFLWGKQLITQCENILHEYLYDGDLVFDILKGIYSFKFPERFSWRSLPEISLLHCLC